MRNRASLLFLVPREEANNEDIHLTVRKIFIGGIRDGLDETALRLYFEKFGTVSDCLFMHDKEGRTRGFAFVEFDGKWSRPRLVGDAFFSLLDYDSVDKVILARPHVIDEHRVDVKKAIPKDQRLHQQQQYALQVQAAYQNYYPIPYAMFAQPVFYSTSLPMFDRAPVDETSPLSPDIDNTHSSESYLDAQI